jgi:hypothetical protein
MGSKIGAYTGPFIVFMLFIGLAGMLDSAHIAPWGLEAKYVAFPLQTVVCGVLLAAYWRQYKLGAPRKAWVAIAVGAVVFGLWVAPQLVFPPRLGGFNPDIFSKQPALYWTELVIRVLRLVIVVPLLEEIFWRGFLLRYLINDEFQAVPFGSYAPRANLIVAVAFMLEHSVPDWPAALVAGFLYNLVAYRTKSLSSCVLAHGVTNALLGGYIIMTRQWGFW